MKRLSIKQYDKLFELVEQYVLTLWDYRRKEELRIEISKMLNCETKDAIKIVNDFYPEIYHQVTTPIKKDLEETFKHLHFSEIH